jgi:hypothetical protein
MRWGYRRHGVARATPSDRFGVIVTNDNTRETLESAIASVMCTLCGTTGNVETNIEMVEARASAAAWAVHFAVDHPDVGRGVSRFLVMTPEEEK